MTGLDDIRAKMLATGSRAKGELARLAVRASTQLSRVTIVALIAAVLLPVPGKQLDSGVNIDRTKEVRMVRARTIPLQTLKMEEMAPSALSALPPPLVTPLTGPEEARQSLPPLAASPVAENEVKLHPVEENLPAKADTESISSQTIEAVAPMPVIKAVNKHRLYLVQRAWSPQQVTEAKAECDRLLKSVTYVAEPLEPELEGACGAPAPVLLRSIAGDANKIDFEPPVRLTCPMVAAMNDWITGALQPAARDILGSKVTRLVSVSSYNCRNRYARRHAPLSEHALMNAVDISGFKLADGRVIRISSAWGRTSRDPQKSTRNKRSNKPVDVASLSGDVVVPPLESGSEAKRKAMVAVGLEKLGAADVAAHPTPSKQIDEKTPAADAKKADPKKKGEPANVEKPVEPPKEQVFLHKVHDAACPIFGTILGPESNEAHRDHFHLDMRARRSRSICE